MTQPHEIRQDLPTAALIAEIQGFLKLRGCVSEPDAARIIDTALRSMRDELRSLPLHGRGNRFVCFRCNSFEVCRGLRNVKDFLCFECFLSICESLPS